MAKLTKAQQVTKELLETGTSPTADQYVKTELAKQKLATQLHTIVQMDAYAALKEHFGLKWQQRDRLDACERWERDNGNPVYSGALQAALREDWATAQRWLEEGGVLQPGLVRGSDGQMHAAGAHYDGGGTYAWDCYCGAAEADLTSLDGATAASVLHLTEVEALVTA